MVLKGFTDGLCFLRGHGPAWSSQKSYVLACGFCLDAMKWLSARLWALPVKDVAALQGLGDRVGASESAKPRRSSYSTIMELGLESHIKNPRPQSDPNILYSSLHGLLNRARDFETIWHGFWEPNSPMVLYLHPLGS